MLTPITYRNKFSVSYYIIIKNLRFKKFSVLSSEKCYPVLLVAIGICSTPSFSIIKLLNQLHISYLKIEHVISVGKQYMIALSTCTILKLSMSRCVGPELVGFLSSFLCIRNVDQYMFFYTFHMPLCLYSLIFTYLTCSSTWLTVIWFHYVYLSNSTYVYTFASICKCTSELALSYCRVVHVWCSKMLLIVGLSCSWND